MILFPKAHLVYSGSRFISLLFPLLFRLKEIDMSEYDATTYQRFSGAVRRQVHSLRIILDSLEVSSSPLTILFRTSKHTTKHTG